MTQTPETGPAPDVDLAAYLRGFQQHMLDLQGRAKPFQHVIDAASVRIESAGREVAVTVTFAGELAGIEFLPAASDVEPAELAASIIAAYHRASETVRNRTPGDIELLLDL